MLNHQHVIIFFLQRSNLQWPHSLSKQQQRRTKFFSFVLQDSPPKNFNTAINYANYTKAIFYFFKSIFTVYQKQRYFRLHGIYAYVTPTLLRHFIWARRKKKSPVKPFFYKLIAFEKIAKKFTNSKFIIFSSDKNQLSQIN